MDMTETKYMGCRYNIPGENILELARHLADKREPQIHLTRDQKEVYGYIQEWDEVYGCIPGEKILR